MHFSSVIFFGILFYVVIGSYNSYCNICNGDPVSVQCTALAAHNLEKTFSCGTGFLPVLRGISATFEPGIGYAIMGVSGSGKSTLMHILAGIEAPTSGSVSYGEQTLHTGNHAYTSHILRESIGLVFQRPYLVTELTVLENVMLRGLINKIPHRLCIERSMELLSAVGLTDKAHISPVLLSGGQQQRVAVARALFTRPAWLIADEPTGSLDRETGRKLLEIIRQGQKAWGMGVIMSTHDTNAASYMDLHYKLDNGLLLKKENVAYKPKLDDTSVLS